METSHIDNYIINDSVDNVDFDEVQELLSTAFWCPGISKKEVIKGASNSALVIGTYTNSGKQVGYLRVISDKTRFAYILDVIVDPEHRKKGIGRAMVQFALEHPGMKDVYQWLLITKDAHEVYRKVGFSELEKPEKWMAIIKPRPVR